MGFFHNPVRLKYNLNYAVTGGHDWLFHSVFAVIISESRVSNTGLIR